VYEGKIVIFDASNYMFRAYFASPPMSNSSGFPTNGLHFYTSMVLSVLRRTSADAVAMAYEHSGPKFRHALYPEYKAHRPAPPEALVQQFPYFRQITDALGIPSYDAQGYEADDVIATLTRQARARGWQVIIASSDKDLMQLIEMDGSVVMLDAMSKSKLLPYVTYADVVSRFQVEPSRVADVLALAGDASDNIPGCKGIGEKTAGKLIAEYGSLETLMSSLAGIKKPAQRANLEAFLACAPLSKKLVELVSDVSVTLSFSGMSPDRSQVMRLFSKFELQRLMKEILGPEALLEASADDGVSLADLSGVPVALDGGQSEGAPGGLARPVVSPGLVRALGVTSLASSVSEVDDIVEAARRSGAFGLWPVWADESPVAPRLLGFALSVQGRGLFVPVGMRGDLFASAISSRDGVSRFEMLLTLPGVRKCVYGLKPLAQYAFVREMAFESSDFFDVELAGYLVHPEQKTALSTLSELYLGQAPEVLPETWLGTGKKAVSAEAVSLHEATRSVGMWAQFVEQLSERLEGELLHHGLCEVYRSLDSPLTMILARMEYDGVEVDVEALKQLSARFDESMSALESQAHDYAGAAFNLNSPKQVGEVLFDKLRLVPPRKKSRQHGYSTDQETLESLADAHPLPGLILEYRALSKLRSTYCEALVKQADPVTHRIHARFHACVTATTRLSSSDPNLQNIPSREALGREIKRAFVAREGWMFLSADYSQIELRILAALSGERMLREAYLHGVDVHARTASAIFDVPFEDVTPPQRQVGKTINFGILYGMGASKLARETGYSLSEARVFLEKFHAQFGGLSSFFESQLSQARATGEVRTILGHRRAIPELFVERGMERSFGERVAINTPIQGSASDIVKRAMLRFDARMRELGLGGRLLIQVHDELLVEVPASEVEATGKALRGAMEGAVELSVPLVVDMRVGKRWADMQPLS